MDITNFAFFNSIYCRSLYVFCYVYCFLIFTWIFDKDKRNIERPKRPLLVWWFDVMKQTIGLEIFYLLHFSFVL